MADDLQRQRGELERTNRLAAWADMARQVAHDIKNPLTPIQLNAEHLRRVHAIGASRSARCSTNASATSYAGPPAAADRVRVLELRLVARPPGRGDRSPSWSSEVVEPYRAGLAGRVAIETDVPGDCP